VLELVQAVHAAFHTESRWLFVFYIGVIGFFLAALLAYVVQMGYERELHERSVPVAATADPVIVRDTAEEERLRSENADLKQQLDERAQHHKDQQTVAEFLEQGNALKAACDSLQERQDLVEIANQWGAGTYKALEKINLSYAARFQAATGPTYSRDLGGKLLPQVNVNVWNWLNIRTDALSRILETMPN
jgi:hypothetical protein